MLHITLKGKSVDQHTSKSFDLAHTVDLLGWVVRSVIEITQIRYFHLTKH